MDGWIERRLNGWVCGFPLNCDLWKIPRAGMIGKEKLSEGLRISLQEGSKHGSTVERRGWRACFEAHTLLI